ncbi:MAG: hypothetical protein JSW16_02455 [Dehalococcoidales bacterium]|nr:MAG: hypothetical protein JSW16_02455 [Dehalococcoidales bacterium]
MTERTMACPECGAENLSWRWRCQSCGAALHEGEETAVPGPGRHGVLWWVTFIMGVVYAGVVIFMVPFAWVWVDWVYRMPEGSLIVLTVVIPVGVALAWKWELVGGAMLTATGLYVIIWFLLARQELPLGLVLWLLPLLVVGLLFILSWFLSYRRGRE